MDILGFARLVIEADRDPELREAVARKLKSISPPDGYGKEHDFRVQYFSDSLVFSVRDSIESMLFLMSTVRHFTFSMLSIDVLLRGGIACGRLYVDDQIIFGPALNDAYFLETTISKFPRVVLSMSAIDNLRASAGSRGAKVNAVIRRDFDGVFFIDYLGILEKVDIKAELDDEDQMAIQTGYDIQSTIVDRIEKTIDNPGVYEKVEWVANYWNKMVARNPVSRFRPIATAAGRLLISIDDGQQSLF